MWTVYVMMRQGGAGLAPLLIQIYIPTRNTFLPYILHHTTQMLLERHSKINIFTKGKKKGINNLWGNHHFKSLRILLSPCHCTSLSTTASQAPAPQAACLALEATNCLWEGKPPQRPGSTWKRVPHSHWDWEIALWLCLFLPCWDIT